MNAAELFTGCGGLALGLERAGFSHAFFAESDKDCCAILARHWPDVPIVGDVRDVGADSSANTDRGRFAQRRQQDSRAKQPGLEAPQRHDADRRDARLDLLAGGFPCQPFSAAGKRKGDSDDRYLWPEFARAIRVLRPRAVLLENVPGIFSIRLDSGEPVFGRVLADLAEAGYDAEWFCLRASDVGAPHRRERVFVVAYAISGRIEPELGVEAADIGLSGLGGDGSDAADAERGEALPATAPRLHAEPDLSGAGTQWGIYAPAITRWESLTRPAPRPVDDRGRLDPRFPEWMLGFPEGWVEGVSRTAQLRMLGNAVQVQVGELVGDYVRRLLEQKAAA